MDGDFLVSACVIAAFVIFASAVIVVCLAHD